MAFSSAELWSLSLTNVQHVNGPKARRGIHADMLLCLPAAFGLDSESAPPDTVEPPRSFEARRTEPDRDAAICRSPILPQRGPRGRHPRNRPDRRAPVRAEAHPARRSRHRQGAARRERHDALVSGLDHQADDDLCRRCRRSKDRRLTLDTLLTVSPQRGRAAAVQDGLQGRHQVTLDNALKMLMVKSANDMAVVLAEGVSRLGRGLRRRDERASRAPRHDAVELGQSERPAGRRADHLGARHGDPRPRDPDASFRNTISTGTSRRSSSASASCATTTR